MGHHLYSIKPYTSVIEEHVFFSFSAAVVTNASYFMLLQQV